MELFEMIFKLALTIGVCLLASRFYVHMLQLESYQIDGYGRWMKARSGNNVLITVGIGIGFMIVDYLMGWAFKRYFPDAMEVVQIGCGLLLFVGFLACAWAQMREQGKHEQKKPLVYTPRAKRLFLFLSIVTIILCTVLTYFGLNYLMYALVPFTLILAALIARPYEARINARFAQEAHDILEARSDLVKIGITGSYGKTSTKFMLATVLSEKYNVLATPSSFNTPMGISRVVREQLTDAHQVFIAEMGARHVGDIKELCELVQPTVGVLTAVGPQHLETFGNIETVAKTKNELIKALPENGIAVFAADAGGWVDKLYGEATCTKYRAGITRDKMYMRAESITVSPEGCHFTLVSEDGERVDCVTKLLGKLNIQNLTVACAVAKALGLTMEQIAAGVAKVMPVEHRLQLIPTGNGRVVIDDAFNSNPVGAEMAMEVLGSFSGRRVVITPGMVELGGREAELNREFGRQIAGNADVAILVGEKHTQPIARGLRDRKFPENSIYVVPNLDSATSLLSTVGGDVILFENDLPENH